MSTFPDSGVYTIKCTINEMVYVGSTKNFDRRWFKEHRQALKKNKHPNTGMQDDWNLYGEKGFVFEPVLCCCPNVKDLRRYEQLILDANWGPRCYNKNPVASKPPIVHWRTPQWNANVASSLKGKPLSEEHKAALRNGWVKRRRKGLLRSKASYDAMAEKVRGRKQSPEWIAKRTASLTGRTLSSEQREKISRSLLGRPAAKGTAENLRRIASSLTPEYRTWLGKKGAAKRWNEEFNDPEPRRKNSGNA